MEHDFIGTTEAAERLGITNQSVRNLVRRGDLPAYKIGKVFKIDSKDLDAYIKAMRTIPTEEEAWD